MRTEYTIVNANRMIKATEIDNRAEFRTKFIDACGKMSLKNALAMITDYQIARSHDITKSDYGFK